MYIGVSGNLGSGKSTIARGLANALNCECYPQQSYNISYINDLFREPMRWTTEAQISFMVHKFDAIRKGMENEKLFILDRTFSEDTEVFAERFYDDGSIDDRAIELIRQLSTTLHKRIERPSLIIYCDCSIDTCKKRIKERPRGYQKNYPEDHLAKLNVKIQSWLQKQTETQLVKISTDQIDYRVQENISSLANEIALRLEHRQREQLDLFDIELGDKTASPSKQGKFENNKKFVESIFQPKLVYLAAPFTARATMRKAPSAEMKGLFTGAEYVERIPDYYKRQLTALARAFEGHGYKVLLPHRDINQWGSKELPPDEIAARCLQAVSNADYFVGLISESFGSHTELGYALGLSKPALILLSETSPTSFFGRGVAKIPGVTSLAGGSIPKIINAIKFSDPLIRLEIHGDL